MFGAAFLAELIDRGHHPERLSQLRLLHALENATRRRLARHVGTAELANESAQQITEACDFALKVAAMTWTGFMRETVRIAEAALPHFERMLDLAPPAARDDMHAALDHERSLLEFAGQALTAAPSDAALVRHLSTYAPEKLPRGTGQRQ
ncbi:hypothetical protein [Prauserella muralis]|uniref:hypothetical protein n=1 Tax=Prauserella muralis TaxID=588067 RepID=UPI0011BDA84D|nr:hypothetical protein [Prauserella muralis]